jgi:hypothetical protein
MARTPYTIQPVTGECPRIQPMTIRGPKVIEAPADLFASGDFVLSSGARSDFKIDCDALSDGSIYTFALLIRKLVGPFSTVEGVPSGGNRIAAALAPHAAGGPGAHLIADDVLTSGGSLVRARDAWLSASPGRSPNHCKGAVMFARGPLPNWVVAACVLPRGLWLAPA